MATLFQAFQKASVVTLRNTKAPERIPFVVGKFELRRNGKEFDVEAGDSIAELFLADEEIELNDTGEVVVRSLFDDCEVTLKFLSPMKNSDLE